MKLSGAYNCAYINTGRVFQAKIRKSLIGNNLHNTSSLSLGNKTQSINKQDD